MNATEPIRRQAAAHPDRVAYVTVQGDTLTFGQLNRTIDLVGGRLLALGVAPGQTAALSLNEMYPFLVVALALGRIGAAFAPSTLPAKLTDVAIVDRGAPGNGCPRVVTIDACWPDPSRDPADPPPAPMHEDGSAAFMLCPSSGTTGRPKFTVMTHDLAGKRMNPRAYQHIYRTLDGGLANGRVTTFLGPATAYGFTAMLHVLANGAAVAEPNVFAERMLTWFATAGVTHMIVSPITLQRMMDALPAQRVPNSLAVVEIGGGLVPAALLEAVRDRLGARAFVTYGASECGRVAAATAMQHRATPGIVGRPVEGATVEVVDDEDRPVPPGVEGAVRIRGERCATHYLDNPEDTAATFRNGWVYPGDRGVMDADGALRIVGREDDVINRGGAKINPGVLEAALMALGGLREVAVFGVPAAGFTTICAAIVPDASFDGSTFLARCREKLGANAPAFVMGVHALPRNENGKVLRQELARVAMEADARAQAQAAAPAAETRH